MKILFLSGSNNSQKSGVADYISCLISSPAAQQVDCLSLSLHEPSVSTTCPDLSTNSPTFIRYSASDPWSVKSQRLTKQIEKFSPDWISLQYVPYAFHRKGTPLGLLSCLSSVKSHSRWHVMAHELWVDPSAGMKNRLLSKVQREILRQLLRTLQPRAVHTSNFWYRDQLCGIGWPAEILPLFSSIPFAQGFGTQLVANRSEWIFLLFGSINAEWHPEPLLCSIEQARLAHGKDRCHFISVGNLSDYAINLWDSLDGLGYNALRFSRLGELSPEDVSLQMQQADFGIAVTPSHLIEKSASAAAMKAHGLPILIDRVSASCEDWHKHLKQSGYILLDDSFISQMGAATKSPPANSLDIVARQFIDSLRSAM
jgi:hypothetical protein